IFTLLGLAQHLGGFIPDALYFLGRFPFCFKKYMSCSIPFRKLIVLKILLVIAFQFLFRDLHRTYGFSDFQQKISYFSLFRHSISFLIPVIISLKIGFPYRYGIGEQSRLEYHITHLRLFILIAIIRLSFSIAHRESISNQIS